MPRLPIKAWVAETVMEEIRHEADRASPLETGGVLMGYWVRAGFEFVITTAIGPGPDAVHSRNSFTPDALFHEREIARLYRQSGRLHTYLGDWHTHPEAPAYLSADDQRTLRRIADHEEARAEMPIMGVLAGGDPWRLAIWALMKSRAFFGLSIRRTQACQFKVCAGM
jgi:integrative and conjugative element protein (TIGR02256 family)